MTVGRGHTIADKYRLLEPIGAGGMGTVFRAEHLTLGSEVAVKLLTSGATASEAVLERFKREARAVAQLKTPNVVQVFDYGVHDGQPYMVMELLEGEDLEAVLVREGTVPLRRTAEILRQVCKGLTQAHAAGLVHRDLKPANLFLASVAGDEVVKILDFGIAKHADLERSPVLTSNNAVLGSPLYMSPEQTRSERVDARSDLWSLGVVLLEMLTGSSPFAGNGIGDVFVKICTAPIPLPSQLGVLAPGLDEFFARALSRAPDQRFASAHELWRGFEQVATSAANVAYEPTISAASIPRTAPARTSPEAKTPRRPGRDADTLEASATAPPAALPVRAAGRRRFALLASGAAVLGALAAITLTSGRDPPARAGATLSGPPEAAGESASIHPTTEVLPQSSAPRSSATTTGRAPLPDVSASAAVAAIASSKREPRGPPGGVKSATPSSVPPPSKTSEPKRDPVFGLPVP